MRAAGADAGVSIALNFSYSVLVCVAVEVWSLLLYLWGHWDDAGPDGRSVTHDRGRERSRIRPATGAWRGVTRKPVVAVISVG